MTNAYVLTGTITDTRTVVLDEPVPIPPGKVRLVVESAEPKPRMPIEEFERTLRQQQQARGHVPPTKEEVDAYLKAERDSWDF